MGISRPLLWDMFRTQVEVTARELDAHGEHCCERRIRLIAATAVCERLDQDELCTILRIKSENVPESLKIHLVGMAASWLVDEVDGLDQGRIKAHDVASATA